MKLLQPADLALRPRLVGELGERRAAPEREGLAQPLGRGRRLGPARLGHEALEAVQIEAARLDAELVAPRPRDDHVVAERLAELGDVRLQDLRRSGRRAAGPEILDQPVARHGLVRVQEQDRQERTWLRRVQRDNAPVRLPLRAARVRGTPWLTVPALYRGSTAPRPAPATVVLIDHQEEED